MAKKHILEWSEIAGANAGTWSMGLDAPMVTCPENVAHVATLGDHKIDEDGVVTPSLVCPYAGCGFHEWVRLEGFGGRHARNKN